jgi:hypothetical protein
LLVWMHHLLQTFEDGGTALRLFSVQCVQHISERQLCHFLWYLENQIQLLWVFISAKR